MLTWFLFIPAAALFMMINIVIGCYVFILLGYGPPNWQSALNQVIRLTTLQDRLNGIREWLEKKVPKVDKLLTRLHIPKPIIIVDTTPVEEEDVDVDEDEIEKEEEKAEEIDEEVSTSTEAVSEPNAEVI